MSVLVYLARHMKNTREKQSKYYTSDIYRACKTLPRARHFYLQCDMFQYAWVKSSYSHRSIKSVKIMWWYLQTHIVMQSFHILLPGNVIISVTLFYQNGLTFHPTLKTFDTLTVSLSSCFYSNHRVLAPKITSLHII